MKSKTKMPTVETFIQYNFGSSRQCNWRRKRNKKNQDWKRSNLTACRQHDKIYRKP